MPDPQRIIGWAWQITALIWFIAAFTSKRTVRRQAVGSRIVQICLGVLAALLILGRGPWNVVLSRPLVSHSHASAELGLVLTVAGLGFSLWARFALGRNWSGTVTIKRDHKLVRSGPYAIVRHPIYSGILLALLGTAIALGHLGAFVGLAVAALALRLKTLSEESFMVEQFGAQYSAYQREVKGLIPFVL